MAVYQYVEGFGGASRVRLLELLTQSGVCYIFEMKTASSCQG